MILIFSGITITISQNYIFGGTSSRVSILGALADVLLVIRMFIRRNVKGGPNNDERTQ